MAIDRRRHGRQIKLREIGDAGQEKLVSSTVALVGAGFARLVEERYVHGAGIGVAVDGASSPDADARMASALERVGLGLRHEASREIAEGAFRALVHVRTALEVSS